MATKDPKALANVEPHTKAGLLTREALQAETEQRALLAQYIRDHMRLGTDFGKIPGTQKDTLLKPGAEKLVELFRCTPKFVLVKCEEDFEKGFFNYIFRVRLVQRDSGAVVAEGFGSANSREGRYRWRDAQRKCPKCMKATIFHSKDGGWYCWKKKEGCGATFDENTPAIVSQVAGKVENDDIATLANTILKMAKKRAMVDGAIALGRCSDMFTQDEEDLAESEERPQAKGNEPPHSADAQQQGQPQQTPPPGSGEKRAPSQASARTSAPTTPSGPVVDVKPGEEEQAAKARQYRAQKIWSRLEKAGMKREGFAEWVTHVLAGAKAWKDWTHEDMVLLEAAVAEIEQGMQQEAQQ